MQSLLLYMSKPPAAFFERLDWCIFSRSLSDCEPIMRQMAVNFLQNVYNPAYLIKNVTES
jgi:hypothetical protein